MTHQTYNPILEQAELRRIRIGSRLRTPAIGTALVLERSAGEPLVVWPGGRVPDPRTGNYRRMYRVDMANRGLAFTGDAPSSDAVFPFTVTVRLTCRVVDPVRIVRDAVWDMTAALSPSIGSIVREVASGFDAMHPTAAETAITARLSSAYSPRMVQLSGFSVSVSAADIAEIVTTRREIRVQEMRRDAMRPVAGGGRQEMLAHLMSIDGGNPMSLLDRERDDREAEIREKLDALRILMGETTEDFDAAEVRKQVLSEFFPGEGLSIPGKQGGIRDRLEKRSGRGRVIEGKAPSEPERKGEAAPPAGDEDSGSES
ncbi:MAG TPA: hypothetical protein VJT49_28215 [Amycolatopsis sp.]|uniref:hypothetical protein n=1 Tax=Amycolatopsis sp. TaxID=37632 RepID=UPI002B49DA54|nr:hypothetical protein [Amycolatopsis sp.]HKS48923.1 hypothetical protein [Amycolatopsis sp.]